ncbi:hypothetical protein FBUS_01077 [Fasciolopsis buskii]|uniref:Uncharacterized protein n=1 Tax=Fasciolopsis buskii TaxID=27845 RepID=A0A8E0S1Y8_9TREM|nr:hypothetical protein FBUS_01077 [Fasciolopsis buski]
MTKHTLVNYIEALLMVAKTSRAQHRSRLGVIAMCKAMRTLHSENGIPTAQSILVSKSQTGCSSRGMETTRSPTRKPEWPHSFASLWKRCRCELIKCQLCELVVPVRLKSKRFRLFLLHFCMPE